MRGICLKRFILHSKAVQVQHSRLHLIYVSQLDWNIYIYLSHLRCRGPRRVSPSRKELTWETRPWCFIIWSLFRKTVLLSWLFRWMHHETTMNDYRRCERWSNKNSRMRILRPHLDRELERLTFFVINSNDRQVERTRRIEEESVASLWRCLKFILFVVYLTGRYLFVRS